MSIRYETGVATLVQFIVGVGLSFIAGVASIVSGCHNNSSVDCVSNTFVSLSLIIIVAAGYAFLLGLGYVAQDRRSTRLAYALIGFELFACLIFFFDTRHATGLFDRLTNLISLVIAGWVVYVAWQLSLAKGGRLVRSHRSHHQSRPY